MFLMKIRTEKPFTFNKYLTVTLEGDEIEEIATLAANFTKGQIIERHHMVGAAGQLIVRKAFPQLEINGQKFENGDGWSDYLRKKIDAKTCMLRSGYMPCLWLRRDLVCDRFCTTCEEDRRYCRGLLTAPAQVYIGVEMDRLPQREMKWTGRIYGFSTTRKLQELYRTSLSKLRISRKTHCIGYPANMLFSMQSFCYYLKHRHNPSSHVHEYFAPEDLDVLDSCFLH